MKKVIRLFTIFIFLLVFFLINKAYAQAVIPLIVSPARQEVAINPGEKTVLNVTFYNQGTSAISGIVKAADFIVDNSDGTPTIIDNAAQASPRFSASTWITLQSDKLSIASKDKASVPIVITAPKDVRPGGRYIAVFFEPEGTIPSKVGTQQEAGSGTAIRLASLVYIRVAGDITEKALVSRFYAKPFSEFGPIKVEADILNRGDYHITPKAVIALTNMFGGVVSQEKFKEENIFPDQTRTFLNELGSKWMMGRYKLSLTATYGQKGQPLSNYLYVWVFPWRVALIILLSLIILILIVKGMSKKAGKVTNMLEKELQVEKEEIERLKAQLKNRS
jgi:hypothetical protein